MISNLSSDDIKHDFSLIDVVIPARGKVTGVAYSRALAAKEKIQTSILQFKQDGQYQQIGVLNWAAIGISAIPGSDELMIVGRHGETAVISTNGGITSGWVDQHREPGPILGLKTTGNVLMAYGMNLNVYSFENGTFTRSEGGFGLDGIEVDSAVDGVRGVGAICEGRNGTSIAGGVRGEIWRLSNGNWSREFFVPNELFLSAAYCSLGDTEFMCGYKGGVAINQGDCWELLPKTSTDVDAPVRISSAAFFAGEFYVADGYQLWMRRQDVWDRVKGAEHFLPAAKINVAHGQIVVSSSSHLFTSEDGIQWHDFLE